MQPAVGIIFDMDGVLVDSGDAHRRAWQQLGREVGTPFPDELFQQTFGQRNASIIPVWLGVTLHDLTPAGALAGARCARCGCVERTAPERSTVDRYHRRARGD
jgi:beta-phosphoglucomutase-like phosphatase (HAD superfamily)